MMKEDFISADEKQIIQAARKVMAKLSKRYIRLRAKSSYVNCEHYKMYKELNKLKIDVDIYTSEHGEGVQLSLNSEMASYLKSN